MKKTLFTLTLLTLLFSVSSCSKEMEGKYNPKEKIQAVYQEYAAYYEGELQLSEPKYMSEEWVWKDSQLDRILYYEQYTYEPYEDSDEEVVEQEHVYTQLFTYDGDGRLTKSEVLGQVNMTTTCEYEGKYLKSMTVMEEREMIVSFLFNREGNVITSFDLTLSESYFDMDKEAKRQLERIIPLRFVLSTEQASAVMSASQSCVKQYAKCGAKGNPVLRFELEWAEGNVTKIGCSYMGSSMQYAFNYDDKTNPFNNLFETVNVVNSNFLPFLSLSKNNVTAIAFTQFDEGEQYTDSEEYTYTYNNKNYPTSKTLEGNIESFKYVETTYYEY